MNGEPHQATTPSGVISGDRLRRDVVLKGVRRALGPLRRYRYDLSALHERIQRQQLIHHPLWLGKILSYADRPPFPPKKIPNVAFVDAVSGYRGTLERVPTVEREIQNPVVTAEAVISTAERAERYVRAVLHTVNRSYVLKKPRHELVDLELVLLPLWHVTLDLEEMREVYVNAVTGEPESYMAGLWHKSSWLTVAEADLAPLMTTR